MRAQLIRTGKIGSRVLSASFVLEWLLRTEDWGLKKATEFASAGDVLGSY